MSAANAIENSEELENVALVRMEDVQPSRDRNCEVEVLETCVVDDIEYDCVDDEDSNIGSMVSIQSEDVVADDSDTAEMIVPEVLEPLDEIPIDIVPEQKHTDLKPPDSWPTLEILPGGVIKNADKCEDDLNAYESPEKVEKGEMMYACAKCSQSFKYLFCLVKHVKWHEDEKKKEKGLDMTKLTTYEKEFITIKRARQELDKEHKKKKVEVFTSEPKEMHYLTLGQKEDGAARKSQENCKEIWAVREVELKAILHELKLRRKMYMVTE